MTRVLLQPGYILHHRPYRDTSLILEVFTRDHGRVTIFARGVRGGKKGIGALGSMLQPFNRLLLSWTGRGEAGQLIGAEFDGEFMQLPHDKLVSGFYLNELLLKLFQRHDAHPDVFALYADTLVGLKRSSDPAPPLRIFEKRLLEALGYGLGLEHEFSGAAIEPGRTYHYRLEQGAQRIDGVADGSMIFSGESLLALARENFAEPTMAADARRLLRAALDRCLEGRELKTREVMLALRKRK